jgi:hypothetical protein
LSYWKATPLFGIQKQNAQQKVSNARFGDSITINFFLDAGPLSNLDKYYGKDNEFWQQLRIILAMMILAKSVATLKDIKPVMTVGGFFDAGVLSDL